MRERTEERASDFYSRASELYSVCKDQQFRQTLNAILVSEKRFAEWFPSTDSLSLDPAIPTLFSHLSWWGDQLADHFDVVHDKSKPIFASKETFDLFSGDVNAAFDKIGYDRRTFGFPLKARNIEFGDSNEEPSLQICDIVAGSLAHWYANKLVAGKNELGAKLDRLDVVRFAVDALHPTPEVDPVQLGTNKRGGRNAVEAMLQYALRKKGSSRKS
jgi:hypothetical protein